MERLAVITQQGWDDRTVRNLMEYFIEANELGEQFDAYLIDTAQEENASTCDESDGPITDEEWRYQDVKEHLQSLVKKYPEYGK